MDSTTISLSKKALKLCNRLAGKTGSILKKYFRRKIKSYVKDISPNLVTEIDFKCEEIILDAISREFPGHNIISEETKTVQIDSDYTWHVDPLDGTINYLRGLPFFCVSFGLLYRSEPIFGYVHSPVLDETFWAIKGKGAFLNGKKISVTGERKLKHSFLVTGFPYHDKGRIRNLVYFNDFIMNSLAVRRVGSAALDLCYVASGVFDGFWEIDLKSWDVAGGILIVQEAMGKVSDFKGGKCSVDSGEIVATNGLIHSQMLKMINKYDY
ncbi:MAG: inositol monophosphatase [Planctomycetes bacterium]|nr:inositol monophosphatase [Planctomycetota bacterium]